MSNFRTIDRETGFLLPPSVDEWLPEKHLARFVVEVVDGLDLHAMSGAELLPPRAAEVDGRDAPALGAVLVLRVCRARHQPAAYSRRLF